MHRSKKVNRKTKKGPKRKRSGLTALSRIHPQVAGIDLGSREHWVCAPEVSEGEPNVRTFGTTMPQLQQLADWLLEQGVESVAMESTNVYWIPLYELLESCGIEVLLVNARQLRYVPGRKTDMRDCQWIQLLHSCGLLRASFRPHEVIIRVRTLHRQLSNLVAESSRFVQWMQKALDQMNVQIHRAVTDLTGQTGMAIVRAIVAGERDPLRLAALRDGRCKKSSQEFAEHLTGNWREEHLFNLKSALEFYDITQREIAAYEARILEEIQALQPVERRDQPVPKHPNAIKEKAIRRRGGHNLRTRTVALCRGRPDAHRRHRRRSRPDPADRGRPRPDGVPLGEALCLLATLGSENRRFRRQAAPIQEARRNRVHPCRCSAAHGGRLPEALQDRSRRRLPSQGPPQGMECRRLLHRASTGRPHLPDAALRPGLCRHRRGPLRSLLPATPPCGPYRCC